MATKPRPATPPGNAPVKPVKPVVRRSDALDTSNDPTREPLLPHEQDQSASNQHTETPDNVRTGRQATADVNRGLVDTDRAPVMDKLYREEFAPARKPRPARKRAH